MGLLPATASNLEVARIAVALAGLIFTAGCSIVMIRATYHVALLVKAGVLRWTGPRWKYALGMVVAMGLFAPGWIAFLGSGLIAASLPTNPATPPYLSDTFGWMVLLGQVLFAAGQATILVVWYLVKSATLNQPNWAPEGRLYVSTRTGTGDTDPSRRHEG